MHKNLSLIFSLGCCTLGNFLVANSAIAQEITTDGTTDTQVTPDGNGNFTINQGDRAGDNLFHSFDNFSVPTNGSASFNNATNITNIFNRVTGGNISNIDGLIEANGTANLFLINPAGIMFGSNARLDIGGSFLGTTADSILFEDGTFSATDLDNPPLLTINAPIGLNFRDNPSTISNNAGFQEFDNGEVLEDSGLTVDEGEFISLVGGDINLNNGRLTAPGGRIELGGLSEAGIVQLSPDLSLNFAEGTIRSDVSLTGIAELDVTSGGGGDINIYARDINIRGGSDVCAGIGADGACGSRNDNFGSIDAQAGDITFNAIETITIDGGISDVNNNVNFNGVGNGGNINIQTKSLFVTNGGRINTTTDGAGNSGRVSILATNQLFLSDSSENTLTGINSNVNFNGVDNSGGITIDANSISVIGGAQIQSLTNGTGNSGKILIEAESVEFSGRDINDFPSGAFSIVSSDGRGNAGGVDITAKNLLMSDRAQLLSNTQGMGNAADVNLQIAEQTTLVNSSILSEVSEPNDMSAGGFGEGGDINITTSSLLLQNGSSLLADTENIGNAGSININASEQFILEGEGLSSAVGGRNFIPSQVSSTVQSQAVGDGGSISISTSALSIRENAADNLTDSTPFISTSSSGEGQAGIIDITATEIDLEDGVRITAETFAGEGGNIFLNISDNLTLRDGSSISARAFNNANGGNLTIDTGFIIAFPNGNNDIIANAQQGEGGVITINAESLLGITERPLNDLTNDINATSQDSTLDGNIVINTSDINPIQGATELPINPVDLDRSVVQACRSNQQTGKTNSFVVNGRGGVPATPTAPLTSESVTLNGQPVANSQQNAIATSKGYIIPARGVVKTKDGRIILTANPSSSYERSPNGLGNCNGV